MYVCMYVCSVVSGSLQPHGLQAPLNIGLPRQEYWSGLPFPFTGGLSNPGIEPKSPASPALAGRFFITESPGKPQKQAIFHHNCFPYYADKKTKAHRLGVLLRISIDGRVWLRTPLTPHPSSCLHLQSAFLQMQPFSGSMQAVDNCIQTSQFHPASCCSPWYRDDIADWPWQGWAPEWQSHGRWRKLHPAVSSSSFSGFSGTLWRQACWLESELSVVGNWLNGLLCQGCGLGSLAQQHRLQPLEFISHKFLGNAN